MFIIFKSKIIKIDLKMICIILIYIYYQIIQKHILALLYNLNNPLILINFCMKLIILEQG